MGKGEALRIREGSDGENMTGDYMHVIAESKMVF